MLRAYSMAESSCRQGDDLILPNLAKRPLNSGSAESAGLDCFQ